MLRLVEDGRAYAGVSAVQPFPATRPGRFLRLRYTDGEGQEQELGLVRDPAEWPQEARVLLEQALARRYFIREITAIERIELKYGLLTFCVQTDRGPAEFTMRSSPSQTHDFGPTGRILTNMDDNRFLVADVEALPRQLQALFRRYVYW